jgi:hypothetical protein
VLSLPLGNGVIGNTAGFGPVVQGSSPCSPTTQQKKATMSYEFSSTGIRVKGDDSFHVFKLKDVDEWILIRLRNGVSYRAATFMSPDEARAFAHSLDLDINRVKE